MKVSWLSSQDIMKNRGERAYFNAGKRRKGVFRKNKKGKSQDMGAEGRLDPVFLMACKCCLHFKWNLSLFFQIPRMAANGKKPFPIKGLDH
ncbi:MAG TPA: hypothetical protein VN371_10240 [Chlorobaculum sp.]|nr:hypothetical protein [Chlorobaculum sp.]